MPRLRPLLLAAVATVTGITGATGAFAESPACNQAREIVAEVETMYQAGAPNHAEILRRLATARDLCPSLGATWRYSYCSALALGDKKADFYKGRAAFNGVQDLSCPGTAAQAAAQVAALPTTVRKKHALLVGIGEFADPDIPRLRFAAKDARDLAAVLVDPRYGRFAPEDVHLLIDAQATRANILDQLQELLINAREDDLVVLYVSSHGSPNRERGEGLADLGYIVTYDTDLDRLWQDALEFQDLSRKVSLLKARRKVTFLDTCFSGQAQAGAKALLVERGVSEETARRFLSGVGSYVVTASRHDQKSWESERLENGFFTHFLIDALRQGAEPPTLRQVFGHLESRVREAVAREKKAAQTPQMFPRDSAEDLRIGVAPRP